MSDPSLDLQGALATILKANSGVTALVGARVYDDVPDDQKRIRDTGKAFPYINLGEDQVIGDDDECAEGSQVFTRIHAWSRERGFPEVKRIAAAVRTAIRAATFALSGFTVNEVRFEQTQYLRDPDGLTRHAVIDVKFIITHG